MKRTTIILIVLLNLFTYGLDIGITFLTFSEIFIAGLIIGFIFKPIQIEINSVLWAIFAIISIIPFFTNSDTIDSIDFILSLIRLLFWVSFIIIVFPHIRNDILNNQSQFYKLIMNITMIVSIICIIQYLGYHLGLNQNIINLKFLNSIMRSHEARMMTEVLGIKKIRPASIYVEPSFFALIVILNTLYLIYGSKNIKDLNKCIFFLVAVAISNSFFGTLISLIFMIVIYIKYPKSIKTRILLLILAILGGMYFPLNYIINRFTGKIYKGSTMVRIITPLNHIKETLSYRPLFGLGWNNTMALARNGKDLVENYISTGNIISYIFISTGIIGFCFFVLIFTNLLKNKINKLFLIALLMSILLSTGDFLIPYFWYLILILSVIPNNKNLYKLETQ